MDAKVLMNGRARVAPVGLSLARPLLHTFGDRAKPALLLLHGIGAGHRLWRKQIDRFQSTHLVLVPDMPLLTGPAKNVPVSLADLANSLASMLREQAIDRLSVCGISAGASVGLALALRMTGSVRHLVLCAPQARAPRFGMAFQIAVCRAMPEPMLLRMAAGIYRHDREVAAAAAEDCTALGKRGLLKAMQALWTLDLRERLSEITAATWILCGSRDRVNIPAARAIAAIIPRAVLRIEPALGHLWNIESPARFNEALAAILAGPE